MTSAPKTSIDYAVMERTDRAVVLTADVGWSDVGEWSAVWRLSPRDANGNSLRRTGGSHRFFDDREAGVAKFPR
jgi:mannose-1-phosphate guanylyltransferase/mannose-6-phosphate isomerase